jgi:hypothetical protein
LKYVESENNECIPCKKSVSFFLLYWIYAS